MRSAFGKILVVVVTGMFPSNATGPHGKLACRLLLMRITSIPVAICDLKKLKELGAAGNPIKDQKVS